jgi:hypothetical protein
VIGLPVEFGHGSATVSEEPFYKIIAKSSNIRRYRRDNEGQSVNQEDMQQV